MEVCRVRTPRIAAHSLLAIVKDMEILVTLTAIAAGGAGYLLVTFVFQPILRFRAIRSQVLSDLVFYRNAIKADGMGEKIQNRLEQ